MGAHFTHEFAIAIFFSHWEVACADSARARILEARDREDGSTSSNSSAKPESSSPPDSSPSLPSPTSQGATPDTGTVRSKPDPVRINDVMERDAKADGGATESLRRTLAGL